MSGNQNIKPTVAELEILQILWEKGEVTVKEVNEEINKRKETGYTTTLKTMQIMFEKGLVERKKDGRSHSYSAAIKKEKTQQVLLDKILETAFGGSASKLVMQALGNKKTTKEELREIKELINKLEEESK
ncbi:MAG: BlaI/MecI/CopY family transcriptional regulator [Melioribacteraceae bacterium]|nr:MAG: BlaI/MecI/CopY family transcriptional regulator [Melioribacteraceae bacterium]